MTLSEDGFTGRCVCGNKPAIYCVACVDAMPPMIRRLREDILRLKREVNDLARVDFEDNNINSRAQFEPPYPGAVDA